MYYNGIPEQWEQINIGINNGYLVDAIIHYEDIQIGDLDGVPGVDEDDAIYLLRYVLLPESTLIEQDLDFDGNGVVNEDDAIYLLRHTLMPKSFPL